MPTLNESMTCRRVDLQKNVGQEKSKKSKRVSKRKRVSKPAGSARAFALAGRALSVSIELQIFQFLTSQDIGQLCFSSSGMRQCVRENLARVSAVHLAAAAAVDEPFTTRDGRENLNDAGVFGLNEIRQHARSLTTISLCGRGHAPDNWWHEFLVQLMENNATTLTDVNQVFMDSKFMLALADCPKLRKLDLPERLGNDDDDAYEDASSALRLITTSCALEHVSIHPEIMWLVDDDYVAFLRAELPLKSLENIHVGVEAVEFLGKPCHAGLTSLTMSISCHDPEAHFRALGRAFANLPSLACLEIERGRLALPTNHGIVWRLNALETLEFELTLENGPAIIAPRLRKAAFRETQPRLAYLVEFMRAAPKLEQLTESRAIWSTLIISEEDEQSAAELVSLMKQSHWPRLTKFDVQRTLSSNVCEGFAHCNSLRELRIVLASGTQPTVVSAMLRSLPLLESADISSDNDEKQGAQAAVTEAKESVVDFVALEHLRTLSLSFATDESLSRLRFPKLDEILLACKSVNILRLSHLLQRMPSLRCFHAYACVLSDERLEPQPTFALHELQLTRVTGLSEALLVDVVRRTAGTLQNVTVNDCFNTGELLALLAAVPEALPKLRAIDMRLLDADARFETKAVANLAKRVPGGYLRLSATHVSDGACDVLKNVGIDCTKPERGLRGWNANDFCRVKVRELKDIVRA